MGGTESVDQLVRRLEKYVFNLKAVRELNTLTAGQRKIIGDVTQNITLARAQILFSLGDEDEQARSKGFDLAVTQLKTVIAKILQASMDNLLDTIEVTQLTVLAEVCIDRLHKLQE